MLIKGLKAWRGMWFLALNDLSPKTIFSTNYLSLFLTI